VIPCERCQAGSVIMNQPIRLIVITALFALPLVACDPDEDSAQTEAIVDEAIASVSKPSNWRSVIIREADSSTFSLAIDYVAPPPDFQVEQDTEKMARAVLAQLIRSGYQPSRGAVVVIVYGVQTGLRDETGADLMRTFGAATYDPKSDSVKFEPVH
jgi:hypothetical protein